MNFNHKIKPLAGAAALMCACLSASAATIVIQNRDPAGVGFNDPTPAAPVGGNMGVTLGQQRMNVYRHVATIWEAALESSQTITISAGWDPLECNRFTGFLGAAGPLHYWRDFPGGKPATWYPQALANKLAGTNLIAGNPDDGSGFGNADIISKFNVNLGKPGCIDGASFYLGLDGRAAINQFDFKATLLHEVGHGMGFLLGYTHPATGLRANPEATDYDDVTGLPTIWESFMYDNAARKTWLEMGTPDERKASAVRPGALTWNGPNAVAAAAQVLKKVPQIKITTPAQSAPAAYDIGTATFGKAISMPMNAGYVVDTASQACAPMAANSLSGRVAIVNRGTCGYAVKAKVVQDAGAVAMIVVHDVAGADLGMGGVDSAVVIPSVMISRADGAALRALVEGAKKYGSRAVPGMVKAVMDYDPKRRVGTDAEGRPLLYTPAALALGSSVVHWDTSATPNVLMEPAINADLTESLTPPLDLTLPLLKDIGW